ncbi:TPA: hypothetical protein N0F65_007715 [Lagenidium giganteum]|uniref:LAGLIDADG endonuclease n=1 Tax=Lagenidium giganteum TaxID=4803 RepID=A0AAV2Z2V1_9STRA|nr:TPA: hypothetical protein N0F65_007715 [Lagenidium giganteum]
MSNLIKAITSDHDLIELAKNINIHLDGIYGLDEIHHPLGRGSYLILLGDGSGVGHWCVLGNLKYNYKQYQGVSKSYCGIWSLLWLYSKQKNKPYLMQTFEDLDLDISIDITQPQILKLGSGKTVTLSAAQLKGSGTSLYVHPANYEKMMKSKKANRGCRIQIAEGEMQHDLKQGGSLWSWLKDTLWPAVKPALSGVLDAAVQPVSAALGPYGAVAPIGRNLIKNLTGVGIKTSSKRGRLVKGSPEAKAYMQAIRSKRRGGSFRLS